MMEVEGYRLHSWNGPLAWESFGIAAPGAGQARVRVEACSIGLTVLNCIRGDLANDPGLLPRVPGHELVGRVEAVGPGVTAVAVGQRVMAYFYLISGTSFDCLRGADSLSPDLQGWVGVHRDGGYATHTVLPVVNLLPLPEGIPAPIAATIPDAVATPLHVCKTRARVRPGDRVVIIGAGGGVGIHLVQMARLFGGDVVGLEIAGDKFPIIEQMGGRPVSSASFADLDPAALWAGARPTVVVDLIGTPASLAWSMDALATGGRMVVLTTFRGVDLTVDPRDLVFREISLLGSRYASRAELVEAAALVASGQITPVVAEVVPPAGVEAVHDKLRAGRLIGRGALDWSLS